MGGASAGGGLTADDPGELLDRIDEIPQRELWIHCGSGYRASIAASS